VALRHDNPYSVRTASFDMSAPAVPIVESSDAKLATLGVASGDLIDGKFRVEALVGTGGMSCVLRARHVALDETVALKCLSPEWFDSASVVDRFSREARAAVKIKSPHVARVYDVGRLPIGIPYMVMELLHGEDMGKLADRRELVNLRECVGWMIEACEGLAEAHALGIVHLDVKPENLFIVRRKDGRGVIKLLDFGISKQLLTSGSNEPVPEANEGLVGTPMYMSPEQVRAQHTLDHRTDIWSLGAVFYEMLTGFPPFGGNTVAEVCAAILGSTPAPPSLYSSDVPDELSRVVLRCLEKDPEQRFPSMAELASALTPFAHPHHQAQVDRIISTLRAAGLTRMAPASVPPMARTTRDSMPRVMDNPTLLEGSGIMQRSQQAPPVTASGTGAGVQLASQGPGRKRRSRGWIALLAVLVVAGTSALVLSRAPSTKPVAQTADPVKAPAEAETHVSAAASAAPVAPLATPSTVSADPAPAAVEAEPVPAPPRRGVRARVQHRTPRAARPAAPPSPGTEQKPTQPAPAPGLDIELSR
jgi:serine/threonine-protein kinase